MRSPGPGILPLVAVCCPLLFLQACTSGDARIFRAQAERTGEKIQRLSEYQDCVNRVVEAGGDIVDCGPLPASYAGVTEEFSESP